MANTNLVLVLKSVLGQCEGNWVHDGFVMSWE